MQLPLTSPLVVVALLSPVSAAVAPAAYADPAEDGPAQAARHVLPPTSPCPAYVGPQCDSSSHEQWLTGQDLVDLAGLPLLAA